MEQYNPQKIEKKWQDYWEDNKLYRAEDFSKRPKYYLLIEFPYPSGEGLHVGHCRSYSAMDAIARKKRMEGFNVLFPIGWDAFGLPTENYAIKTGIHPRIATEKNIANYKRQLKSLGLSFDWSREINTTDPNYYKWTQWIFLKFFERGLAYQAEIPVNWCPACKIGLANEEVISGSCERCGAAVEKKVLKQWMLKITAYADRLLDDLEKLDYLEKIKTQQKNWIGRSEGISVKFLIPNSQFLIEVFTTRIDTIFGATALVIAPEHKIISELKSQISNLREVEEYIEITKEKTEFERTKMEKEKTGALLKGVYAINPVNNEKIPVWVGDYVVAAYGGGAVMVVPAHDKRDYQFAKKYGLEIREVVKGTLINSGEFNGLSSKEAIEKITESLEKKKLGRKTIQYKLRDWVFSRQHYWGEPIPLVFCENCAVKIKNRVRQLADEGEEEEEVLFAYQKSKIKNNEFNEGELLNPGWIAVSEGDLPVELPYVEKYQPTGTGESPLAVISDWVNAKCPKCGGAGRRETDTMPNWAGSNWYYLAYLMRGISNFPASPAGGQFPISKYKKVFEYWMPVDWYSGGMEHTTLHLLYSRFIYKFLYDIGVVSTPEPYQKRTSHGIVLAEDGRKMSKSFGNVINPDEIVEEYGADTLRIYEMFMGPFGETIGWSIQGVKGARRFLEKVWNFILGCSGTPKSSIKISRVLHKLNKKIDEDLEATKFNTIVSSFMEFINLIQDLQKETDKDTIERFLILLSPFAPHISEELWQKLGHKKSVFLEKWPGYDEKLIKEETITLVIQVNGRVRDKIEVAVDISEEEAKKLTLEREKVKRWIEGKEVKKIIFVPGKLINIVI